MAETCVKKGVIRRVLASEGPEFLSHLLRLHPVSRRSRFGGPVSEAFLERYAADALVGDATMIGWFVDGVMHGAAELRPLEPRWKGTAEAAFSVEEAWQDAGVGTALLSRLMRAARNRGLTRLVVICMPDNARMQRIAARHGARIVWQDGDVIGELQPPFATPWSLWREALDESEGIVKVMFDLRVNAPPERPQVPPRRSRQAARTDRP
jgi:GNAT superfamily N-acetyltransferase